MVHFEQLIQPRQPTVFRDYLIGVLIPQVYGFPQQCLHIFCCLPNPRPVELPIGVTSRFIEAHYCGCLYHTFCQGNGRTGFFKYLTDDIGLRSR